MPDKKPVLFMNLQGLTKAQREKKIREAHKLVIEEIARRKVTVTRPDDDS